MNSLPTPAQCLHLLSAQGCSKEVIDHCLAVRAVAVAIARKAHADVALVEAGALLHDIGRSKTQGMTHALEGGRIARQLGLPTTLVGIIEHHIGAGIPKDEAVALGLPAQDFLPLTLEEKIVAHADNLTADHHRQPIADEIARAMRKGQVGHAQRLRLLHDELSAVCGQDLDTIEPTQKVY